MAFLSRTYGESESASFTHLRGRSHTSPHVWYWPHAKAVTQALETTKCPRSAEQRRRSSRFWGRSAHHCTRCGNGRQEPRRGCPGHLGMELAVWLAL